jgi:hypothetical protein
MKPCSCGHSVKWNGHSLRIFRSSEEVAVAYEVLWDFTSLKELSSMGSVSFCDYMSRVYQTMSLSSAPFLDYDTFRTAWSQWNQSRLQAMKCTVVNSVSSETATAAQ